MGIIKNAYHNQNEQVYTSIVLIKAVLKTSFITLPFPNLQLTTITMHIQQSYQLIF